jgi:hypothetical protein
MKQRIHEEDIDNEEPNLINLPLGGFQMMIWLIESTPVRL